MPGLMGPGFSASKKERRNTGIKLKPWERISIKIREGIMGN